MFIQEFFDPAEQARGYYSFELLPGHKFKATSFTIGQWKKKFIASKPTNTFLKRDWEDRVKSGMLKIMDQANYRVEQMKASAST